MGEGKSSSRGSKEEGHSVGSQYPTGVRRIPIQGDGNEVGCLGIPREQRWRDALSIVEFSSIFLEIYF